MRIAFFIPVIAGRGGIETVLVNLLNELNSVGDDPRLFIFSGSRDKAWLEKIPWVREIGTRAQPRFLRLCTYVLQALSHMRRWKPDAIVCTHPSTLRLARFVRRALRLKEMPIILWLHGPLSYHVGIEEILPSADGHICICQQRAEELKSAFSRISPASKPLIYVAYNGTSVEKKHSIQLAAVPTFLYIGRLLVGDEKRVGDILSAAALLKGEYSLKIVGDGPPDEVRRLHEIADHAGIADKLEWLGWQAEPWFVISSATALIVASSFEGFSMVTVEALALGLSVICSEFGGISSEIQALENVGWTFPIGDVARLTAIMQAIVDRKAELPPAESVKKVGSRFSAENMAFTFRSAVEDVRRRLQA